jgi:uncharacterized membrane protein YedE/YeeE
MNRVLAALFAGALFGLGLVISRMSDPTVILGFLDFAGRFDPTLLIVFASGVLTSVIGYRLVLRRGRPVLDSSFHVPTSQVIDAPLIVGAAIFGIGWGLAGYCPGPALVAAAGAVKTGLVFVPAMLAGSLLQRFAATRREVGRSAAAVEQ